MHAPVKGRLDIGHPIAVIDIGSNSVRLVIYEGLSRSPTPIFNEKVLAGPVDCTSRPSPARTFSLKIGVGERDRPS